MIQSLSGCTFSGCIILRILTSNQRLIQSGSAVWMHPISATTDTVPSWPRCRGSPRAAPSLQLCGVPSLAGNSSSGSVQVPPPSTSCYPVGDWSRNLHVATNAPCQAWLPAQLALPACPHPKSEGNNRSGGQFPPTPLLFLYHVLTACLAPWCPLSEWGAPATSHSHSL